MPLTLSPGRFRGLKTTSLAGRDVFGIVAFDQRGSYRRMMPPASSYDDLARVKNEVIGALSLEASAILTDPTYGLGAAMRMNGQSGLLLALEKSGYSGDSSYRKTELIPGWTAEKIRKVGANAVKFMVYYNPQQRGPCRRIGRHGSPSRRRMPPLGSAGIPRADVLQRRMPKPPKKARHTPLNEPRSLLKPRAVCRGPAPTCSSWSSRWISNMIGITRPGAEPAPS